MQTTSEIPPPGGEIGDGGPPDMAALRRRASRGGATVIASRLATQLIIWASTILVARILTSYDYGILALGALFINLSDMLAEAGVGNALVQKERVEPGDLEETFTLSLVISTVLYLALLVIAGPASRRLQAPDVANYLRAAGLVLMTVPFRVVPLAMFARRIQIGQLALISAGIAVVQLFIVLGLALAGAGFWSLALGMIASRFLESVILTVLGGWRPRLRWPAAHARELYRFGLQVSAASFLGYIYTNADFAVIGKLQGAAVLGFYSLAFQMVTQPVHKLLATFNAISYPVYCRMQHEPERLGRWHLRAVAALMAVGAPAMLGVVLVADDAIAVLFGQKWLLTVVPLQLLSVAGMTMMIHESFPPLFTALGRPDINLKATLACALVLPAGFLAAGMFYGMTGVCLVWLSVYPLLFAGIIAATRPITGVGLSDLARALAPVAASLAVMAAAVLAARQGLAGTVPPAARLAASISTGMVSYGGALWVFMGKSLRRDFGMILGSARGAG